MRDDKSDIFLVNWLWAFLVFKYFESLSTSRCYRPFFRVVKAFCTVLIVLVVFSASSSLVKVGFDLRRDRTVSSVLFTGTFTGTFTETFTGTFFVSLKILSLGSV